MRLFTPGHDELTPEQILELRNADDRDARLLPAHTPMLCDIALGHQYSAAERRAARIELAQLYEKVLCDNLVTRDPLSDMLCRLALWCEARRFDDDQDPGEDTDDEALVRSYLRWQALRGVR